MRRDAIGMHSTVREIVDSDPNGSRIFSILGINYCCGYERSLADGARQAGLGTDEVLDLLSGTMAPAADNRTTDWNKASLTDLADYVVAYHHRRARRDLIHLILLAAEVASGHASRHPEIWELQDELESLSRDLIPHMRREEQYLFPYVRSMESETGPDQTLIFPLFGTIEYPLQAVKHDHNEDLSHLASIRQFADNLAIPSRTCGRLRTLCDLIAAFELELQQHIRLENEVLFPRAIEVERSSAQRR
jgi:regulator of cell morphogenesis and NO signaling